MKTLAEPTLDGGFRREGDIQGRRRVQSGHQPGRRPETTATITYDIEKLEYGIGLEFQPVVLSPGRISLKVRTSVSEPTNEGIGDAVRRFRRGATFSQPGMTALSIRKRLADTTVELPSGGSMMIAGLVRDDVRQAINGLPGPVQDAGARHAVPQPGLRPQRDRTRHHRHALSGAAGGAQRAGQAGRQFQRRRATAPACSSAASTASTAPCRPTCPTAAITASSATSTNDRGTGTCARSALEQRHGAASPGRGLVARRQLARWRSPIGAPVPAAPKRDSVTVGAVPDDYRTNHPIVIAEKKQVLDLPVGASDRGMTAPQRDVARRLPRTATTGAPRRC